MIKLLLSAGLILLLVACTTEEDPKDPDQEALNQAIDTINISSILYDGESIDLPSEIEGVTIEWRSDKLGIINLDGQVSLPNTTIQTVKLTATLTIGDLSETKTYQVDVHPSDGTIIQSVIDELSLPNRTIYERDYDFPSEINGVSLEWSSNDPQYLSNEGVTSLPEQGEEIEVTLSVTLRLNETEETITLSTIVTHYDPLHFPDPDPLIRPIDAPIYTGEIEGEVAPPENSPCFAGAWYNKAVSSKDAWLGVEGIITLPEINLWEGRFDVEQGRYLDNPSIYLGGNAGAESDVGLSWMPVCNNAYCLSPGTENVAFRPFWRYIDGSDNIWANSDYRKPEYYYFPGDTLRMTVFSPEPGYLQMEIEVIEVTDIPKYVELRASFRIENNMPANFVSPKMPSVGHGGPNAEFKRVNALDQVGNEGGPAKMTESEANKAIWHEMFLYREIDGELHRIPFTRDRYESMLCPDEDAFILDYDSVDADRGGEVIWIQPKRAEDYDND